MQDKSQYKISVENLEYWTGYKRLFYNVKFSLKRGESIIIDWKEGLGKTIFLENCAGINMEYKGDVYWNGFDIKKLPRYQMMNFKGKSGFIFQKPALISNLNVFENIALPLRYHSKLDNKDVNCIVEEQIERFGLNEIKSVLPEMLTTGESKTVSAARALVMKPELIFMDDPSSGLDRISFDVVMDNLLNFLKIHTETTIVLITTSLSIINKLKFPVAEMKNGTFITNI